MAPTVGFTQTDRALRIDSPLGKDRLIVTSVSGQEAISQLFRFQLDLLSEDDSIKLSDLVGKPVTVHVQRIDGERHFHGFVSRFSQGARDERFTHYRAEVVPWLWFLSRTADCRIFQNKTVPAIIQQIFNDLGFSDFSLRLHGTHREWEYCVQYRETDLNFVSRLMEEEGIFYFFEQAADGSKHTLVLADTDAAHTPCPNQPKASCEPSSGGTSLKDHITELRLEHEFRPSAWAHTDYNFQTPSTSLMINLEEKGPGESKAYEIYDYPGSYEKRDQGDNLARARLQETRAFQKRATGSSNCRSFGTGYTVEVQDHYRSDVNGKYVLTAVHHQATMSANYTSGGSAGSEFFYSNTFEAIPAAVPFRAPRATPKPVVQGCQSAVVTGPSGEEIYTDKFGRVKVQFHWDREGKRNENSSCFVRVSYPWAGKNWGAIHIPRIGQEVLVDFLEGDPDQPIIIGRVYHAENMPPWGLPAKAVISGFKSNSTKGGGGYNEFSMDDTKGNELIQVHAQFDQDIKVEHDERTWVGHDRTETVDNNETITIHGNRTETVDKDEKITIHQNRTETVDLNETISIGVDRKETVGSNETISIGSNRTETVGANETVTIALTRTKTVGINDMLNVGAAQEVTIGGLQALTVGAVRAHTVGASETITIGASQTISVGSTQSTQVGSDQSFQVGGSRSASIAKDDALTVGKTLKINAADEILLQTGSASILMKKDGTIQIKGKDITIDGSGEINVKASKNITMKGQKILQN